MNENLFTFPGGTTDESGDSLFDLSGFTELSGEDPSNPFADMLAGGKMTEPPQAEAAGTVPAEAPAPVERDEAAQPPKTVEQNQPHEITESPARQDPQPKSPSVPKIEEGSVSDKPEETEENPLLAAMERQEEKNAQKAAEPIFAQLPVFSYNGTEEPIEDTEQTFDELRLSKLEDFPEFDEVQSLSWSVVYGTNEYRKLANITFNKTSKLFSYDNLVSDPYIDPLPYCMEAQRLFELYQNCAGRRQIETLLENYVDSMQAVKIGRGHFFFVPRDFAARLQVFEDFVEMLEEHNQIRRPDRDPLEVNSIYVVDDAKQRQKMTAAFYRSVRREITEYEERVTNLIQNGSQSPKIMDRWIMRIQGLEEKKRNYENILKRELTDLDEEFTSLRYLSDELRIRAAGLRVHQRAA